MVKISTPFGVILKILTKGCSAVLSRKMLSVKYGFFHFIESCAAFSHLLLGMRRKYNVHYCVTISYRDDVVKQAAQVMHVTLEARLFV